MQQAIVALAVIGGVWLSHLAALSAAPPAAPAGEATLRPRVERLVQALDSDRFDVRRRAAEELESLAIDEHTAAPLAAEFRRLLDTERTSFEVRTQLESWLVRLPKAPAAKAPANISDEELRQHIARLDADSFAQRLDATRRLESLASQPALAPRVMLLLRDRLAESKLALDTQARVTPLWERARGVWLTSDPAVAKLPPLTDAELARAIADLLRPAPAGHDPQTMWREHAAARRVLLDLLARDECLLRVKEALESRLASNLTGDARDRLQEVLDWTHPALVAEIWQSRQHVAIQHLLVDVARQAQGAPRPSHFSRIDDRTAYCVSGSNLVPGEYPVDVAVPHPTRTDNHWSCHLVNLPTPRRRMAYEYAVRVDERQRLAELTERTLRRYTTEKLYLSELQMIALQGLDPAAVSRTIGGYFLAVDDQRLEPSAYNLGSFNASHHHRMAFILAQIGTRDVVPGLLAALKKDRFLPPAMGMAQYHWPWIAALTIAARDPWPEADAWLAGLIDRADPLIVGALPDDDEPVAGKTRADGALPPDVGAAAAAILLEGHDLTPSTFGLIPAESTALRAVGCPSYRFDTAESRRRVQQWWHERQKARAP